MKITEGLAELCGIVAGDGSIFYSEKNGDYKVQISGDYSEGGYHDYIIFLFRNIFNKVPKRRYKKDGISLCLNSKEVVSCLLNLGLPAGKKKDVIDVPCGIRSNKRLSSSFLRGLSDTDFSVCFKKGGRKRNSYPRISVEMHSKKIIESVKLILSDLDISFCCYNRRRMTSFGEFDSYCLDINGRKNLEKWMELVGFRNRKHLRKIEFWKKNGYYLPGC